LLGKSGDSNTLNKDKSEKKSKERLVPKPSTLRKIHVLSGNQCARPGCNTILVNSNGTFVASVCHIYAAEKNGPRPNGNLTPEQKRSSENLMLLCNVCHKIVDTEEDRYSATLLKKWKADREKVFSEIGSSLKKSYLSQISDERDHFVNRPLKNLDRYIKYLDKNNYSHSIDDSEVQELNLYVEKLKQLTLNDRSLLAKIVETALSMLNIPEGDYGIEIHPDDLKVLRINEVPLLDNKINKFSKTLERHNLGCLDYESGPELRIFNPIDYMGWSNLKEFALENSKDFCQYISQLDFIDLEEK
jgi:5-methylcytosine-specific restriction endonuclease McrA